MKRFPQPWLHYVLVLLALGLAACRAPGGATPTPEGGAQGTPLQVAREVIPLTIAELAETPETYEGQILRLTGAYQPRPQLICNEELFTPPATWGLAADGFLAYAGGFGQLRSLLPTGLLMTAEGRWRRWEGPVGCGQQASEEEIWYLDVSRIVSPSPLTRVTLTPTGVAAGLIAQVSPTVVGVADTPAAGTPDVGPPPTQPAPATALPAPTVPATVTAAPVATAIEPSGDTTATPSSTSPAATASATASPTAGTPGAGSATPTPSRTATPAGNASPTATAPGGAFTPAPGGTPTQTPTATRPPEPVDMGDLDDMFLAVELLGAGELHHWQLDIVAGDVVTAYVAAPAADIALALLDSDGNIIVSQNNSGAGQVETLIRPIDAAGTYRLQVGTSSGTAADYVVMIRYNASYAFVLRGVVTYGNSVSDTLPEENDHFWHFLGTAGDRVTILATPTGQGDLFLQLYDTAAENIGGFVDEGDGGEAEEISITLPETGLYSVRIGEFDFEETGYTLIVVRN